MKQTRKAFSLVEILVGILIISGVMVAAFQSLGSVGIGKVKLIERTNIEKQSYYMAEKFFEMIKKGGTLDYEEYWNRTSYNTTFGSGHYVNDSDFGNIGTQYFCLSKNGTTMPANGCLVDFNINTDGSAVDVDRANTQQIYNRYKYQFIDFNSDADADNGDEDGSAETSLSFVGDDDDLYLGQGPVAFPGNRVGELYLISPDGTKRTFFRWNVVNDPFAPAAATCTGTQDMVGEGCLGTIEFLKMDGIDNGYDHGIYGGAAEGGYWDADGEIDTWLIDDEFNPGTPRVLAGSGSIDYWQPIFPDTVHVSNVEFYAFPNKSIEYAWKESAPEYQIAPYVQIKMTLAPSWKQKRKITGSIPSVDFLTTITLTDLDFR